MLLGPGVTAAMNRNVKSEKISPSVIYTLILKLKFVYLHQKKITVCYVTHKSPH